MLAEARQKNEQLKKESDIQIMSQGNGLYTNGSNLSAALASPCSKAVKIRVTSFMLYLKF